VLGLVLVLVVVLGAAHLPDARVEQRGIASPAEKARGLE
jgi:hypothetical protein